MRDVVVAVLVLAGLSAALLRALLDLGVRAAFQRHWIRAWLQREKGEERSNVSADEILDYLQAESGEATYSLDYRQVCGQIASAVEAWLSDPRTVGPIPEAVLMIFAGATPDELFLLRNQPSNRGPAGGFLRRRARGQDSSSELDDALQRLLSQAERRVDDLQAHLARSSVQMTYTSAFFLNFALTSVLTAVTSGNQGVTTSLVGVCALFGILLLFEPLYRRIYERRSKVAFARLARVANMTAAITGGLPLIFLAVFIAVLLLPLTLTNDMRLFASATLISSAAGVLTPTATSLLDRLSAPR